jgi:hypothetical protein
MTSKTKASSAPFGGGTGMENWTASCISFVEANRRALGNWMKVNETVARGLMELSQEMLRFAQQRFQEDVEANVPLARCHSPSDGFEYRRRFGEKATAQYLEEANKLAALLSRMASLSLSSLQYMAGEDKHDAPDRPA